MKRVNKRPVDHFEGKWEKGRKYTLYAIVKNNGTLFRSLTPKEKDEPYVIYDSENETFSANPGWEIVEMSEDSRLSAMGGNGGGASGQDGKDAGFGTISASVANTSGNPSVAVETSGPDTAKNIYFKFFGLKGNQGIPGVNNADIKVVDALPAASAQTTGRIYLVETETANIYARWYTEVDGSTYAWRQLGTTEVALEDYATKDNLSQLQQEVHNLSGKYYGIYEFDNELPEGDAVGYAFVGIQAPFAIYQFDGDGWEDSGATVTSIYGEPGVGFESAESPTPADGTVEITLSNGDKLILDLNHNHPQYYGKDAETEMPSGGFLPDVVYILGELSGTVAFSLAAAVTGNINHYFWTFSTGASAPTVTFPTTGITWAAGSAPAVSANKHYEISILGGIAYYSEV